MNLKTVLLVCGLALAVTAVMLAVVYAPPAWIALAGLGGYVVAMMGFVVQLVTSQKPRRTETTTIVQHEDGSIEVLR